LEHPNIVRAYALLRHEDITFMVIEYVEGESLRLRLKRLGSLPQDQALRIAGLVCEALAYAHAARVLHRDIKPANIRLRKSDGKAVLVDFGIAKIGGKTVQTRKAARGYTSGYSPPEQYGTGTDSYSDVYALGATLYQLLTGRIPPDSIDIAHSGAVLVPPRSLNPSISLETERVILTAMQLHPQNRYQTAGEMRQALARTIKVQVPQQNMCAACGAVNKATAKFCFSCGAALAAAIPFDLRQVAAWSAGGALIGTVLAYLPRLAIPGGTGPVLEAAIYTGALLFGAVGTVAGAFVARKVNLDAPDFLPKVVVTLVTALALEAAFGLILGAFLIGGGLGPLSLFLAFLGSVSGGIAGIRLTETGTFRKIKW